ncbi:hypothetical protein scyTo_0019273 [Scyliorhinus torazame]|uniref:B-cell scaffold protein with ankyrin repeats n=1 Tax=Scyliorhinus torazame TaxID=75743 RepID=A0A401PW52_SCYTO|nr:hypothetical protein [Scyliorhinus torazame]
MPCPVDTSSPDLLILYEEDAEEWSTYLKQIFSEALNPQSICSYDVGCPNDLKVTAADLLAYKCKLLVLTPGFLASLTTSKRIQLGKILQAPDEVVVLLCGVPSSDDLYKLVHAERGCWELSSDQDAQEYLSVVSCIINSGEATKFLNLDVLSLEVRDVFPMVMQAASIVIDAYFRTLKKTSQC